MHACTRTYTIIMVICTQLASISRDKYIQLQSVTCTPAPWAVPSLIISLYGFSIYGFYALALVWLWGSYAVIHIRLNLGCPLKFFSLPPAISPIFPQYFALDILFTLNFFTPNVLCVCQLFFRYASTTNLISLLFYRGNSKYHYYGIRIKPDSPLNTFPQEDSPNTQAVRQPSQKTTR